MEMTQYLNVESCEISISLKITIESNTRNLKLWNFQLNFKWTIELWNIWKMENKTEKADCTIEDQKVRCVVRKLAMKFMKFIGEVREKMNMDGQFMLDEPRGRFYT